jgi:hypothetical protein
MTVAVADYEHRTGEHCASTALRNLMHFQGVEMSEPMIFGLSGGLGLYYLRAENLSPTRMFHGRTATLESDFCRNTGIPVVERMDPDDDLAGSSLRERLDSGTPVLLFTDTYYLGYHRTTSHFPGHAVAAVGYDATKKQIFLADRKFEGYQTCSFEELRRARNADDYPQRCLNRCSHFPDAARPTVPLTDAVRVALRRNAEGMLTGSENTIGGVGGLRALAADFPSWSELEDWSWAARFGYQVVVKRGAGGSFFRSLYADFLAEAAKQVQAIESVGLPGDMVAIAARWRDLAALLKEQSERESPDPKLLSDAGLLADELARAEESFFRKVQELVNAENVWP